MNNLKNFIDENREGFENENLIPGHKERFLSKTGKMRKNETALRVSFGRIAWAAAIITLLVAIPLLVKDKPKSSQIDVSYAQIIQEKSREISKLALTLNPTDQNAVMTTLSQLEFESIPFKDQLPESLTEKEKNDFIESYYKPKIEGINKLERYIAQLTRI